MEFSTDDRIMALVFAYRALAAALIDTKTLDPERFEYHATMAIARLEAIGANEASSAAAELLEPLLSDLRVTLQRRGGSALSQNG
jgi:hypothetical protein